MDKSEPHFDLDTQDKLALEATGRRQQMLLTAFGPQITAALKDDAVIEVMVNPDRYFSGAPSYRRTV